MKFKLLIALTLVVSGIVSCKKGSDDPQPGGFEAITFKFGADATSISIDQATKTLKNMPRGTDVTQLVATAVLPAGFSISPDPTTPKDYTKTVTYTITNAQGGKYTMQITVPVYDAVSNPYGVYNAKHLSGIRNGLNDSYVLINDIVLPDLTATDAAATVGISDYATYGWYSIGTAYVNGGHVIFRGSLDGQNHTIKNLRSIFREGLDQPQGIDAGHNGKSMDGLFGYAAHATFKNIGIQLASAGINGNSVSSGSYSPVGALIGRADTCTFINCFVSGNGTITGGQQVGGLIGRASYSNISKCYSAIANQAGSFSINAFGDAGGLIGSAFNSEIIDSYSSTSVLSAVNVGGLIGSISTSTVKTCYASGNVTELQQNTTGGLIPFNALGGLIGSVSAVSPSNSLIQNSYATGSVSGANGSNISFHQGSRIGGLIGQISNATTGPVSVTFCYATGTVSRVHTSTVVPYLIGGLVGTTANNIFISSSNCTNYWDKEKTGQTYLGGGNSALAQDNGFTTNGKTSSEMKTGSTFVNWDFSSVWIMSAGSNNGYPYLRSINR